MFKGQVSCCSNIRRSTYPCRIKHIALKVSPSGSNGVSDIVGVCPAVCSRKDKTGVRYVFETGDVETCVDPGLVSVDDVRATYPRGGAGRAYGQIADAIAVEV